MSVCSKKSEPPASEIAVGRSHVSVSYGSLFGLVGVMITSLVIIYTWGIKTGGLVSGQADIDSRIERFESSTDDKIKELKQQIRDLETRQDRKDEALQERLNSLEDMIRQLIIQKQNKNGEG